MVSGRFPLSSSSRVRLVVSLHRFSLGYKASVLPNKGTLLLPLLRLNLLQLVALLLLLGLLLGLLRRLAGRVYVVRSLLSLA